MYVSGRAELTAGEMRDAGKRGPEAGGGAKGSQEEVVGFVHIFFYFKKGGFCEGGFRYYKMSKEREKWFNWIVNGKFGEREVDERVPEASL